MFPSPSSPPQTHLTNLDESDTTSVKSPQTSSEHSTGPQPDLSSSSSHPPAPPTPPVPSPRHNIVGTSTSMSAMQSNFQPNFSSQNLTTTSISTSSSTSCLISPEPRCEHPANVSLQPLDSAIVHPASSTKSRQSIRPSFSFPGAPSSATTTYDHSFPDSADSPCTLMTTPSTESISATSQQTPNVYINGLPPHCSEQELFALARQFGDVKSVRTFTRHVSEKPTGYGFVLFNDLGSAQKCIEGLRKHRNLHPSFSKQVHRIPGTEYAQHNACQSIDQDEDSFKWRMEKLKDVTSTNLYIEGLPLSTDEESLTDLMLPHSIKSSRLFRTKLSNPPRIIAFVRLETRAAAEETIERLHGRMVRGWNDPGCRISVRFADSAEQRELRRTERTLKNGDRSPSRLTIAQAALLNLHGHDLQENIHDAGGCKPQRTASLRPDFQATFNPNCNPRLLPTSRSLPSKMCYTYRKSPLLPASDLPSTSEMDTLLQSIQNGYEDGPLDSTMRNLTLDNKYLVAQQAQLQVLTNAALLSPNPLPITLPRGHTQARNGFTPTEELILEAHAQRLQLQARLSQSSQLFEPIPALRQPGANIRSSDFASHEPLQASGLGKGTLFQDTLPTISEDEFHAMGHQSRSFQQPSHEFSGLANNYPPNASACATSAIFVPSCSRAVSIVPPPPDYEEPGKRPRGQHQHTERSGFKQILRPCPSFNHHQSIPTSDNKPHPSSLQTSTRPNNINSNNANKSSTSITPCDNNELQHTYMYSHDDARTCAEEAKGPRLHSSPALHIYAKKSPKPGDTVKEALRSPCVVSPALTYSSRTPSTLSPATPFFGSFTGSQDAFEMLTMENEDVSERKLKARVANN